jgi:uroporphyrinogen-III synthase
MAFAGLRVLSLESRRAKEMEALIRREGGDPFVAPSVEERALDDQDEALDFVNRVAAGEFDLVVCMTGAGLAFLRDVAAANGRAEALARGLQSVFIVSRGPKPLPILREMGARAHAVVPEPNTWKEVVDAVAARGARRIAVQEYGRPNEEMSAALTALGAQVECFAIYRWDLPADLEPLTEAARGIAARSVDVALFTSSIQLDHLFRIAEREGLLSEVRSALEEHTAIASVGPIMTEALIAADLPADIVPAHPKMAALVKAASEEARAALARKRSADVRAGGM